MNKYVVCGFKRTVISPTVRLKADTTTGLQE